jgi:hypothetical protein
MPNPEGHNRKNGLHARTERRRDVSRLYVEGMSQTDIARTLGVAQGTVSKDITALHRDWLASSVRDFDTAKAVELLRLDAVIYESWQSFRRSCQPPPRRLDSKGNPIEQAAPPGAVEYLREIHACLVTKLKVLGALRPDSIKLSLMAMQQANLPWAEVLKVARTEAGTDTIEAEILAVMAQAQAAQGSPRPIYGLKELPPVPTEADLAALDTATLEQHIRLLQEGNGDDPRHS